MKDAQNQTEQTERFPFSFVVGVITVLCCVLVSIFTWKDSRGAFTQQKTISAEEAARNAYASTGHRTISPAFSNAMITLSEPALKNRTHQGILVSSTHGTFVTFMATPYFDPLLYTAVVVDPLLIEGKANTFGFAGVCMVKNSTLQENSLADYDGALREKAPPCFLARETKTSDHIIQLHTAPFPHAGHTF